MGKNDSSRTRVVPVFDGLMSQDSTGKSWLVPLLRLGSMADQRGVPHDLGSLVANHPRWWGRKERRLAPPLSLLGWLISNVTAESVERSSSRPEVKLRRQALAQRDEATRQEALQLLAKGCTGRNWYTLEGQSSPDAFLETDRAVIVVEGKRTERTCTEKTTFMGRRSQMLRHMDAASEIANGRRVLGVLIVESAADESLQPSEFWRLQAKNQVEEPLLAASLPHRSPAEQAAIASGFVGVATWRAVCEKFGLPWPPA